MLKPHFVRDYQRLVSHLILTQPDYDTAMAQAVGGAYAEIGAAERRLLERHGLQDAHYLIDIGAGSGRLAYALRDIEGLRYFGTDVVAELLDYAGRKCGRPDWRFALVDSIRIPEVDGAADFVTFFSVFTHLNADECLRYLREACRVLKPGGRIVVSFLDRTIDHEVRMAGHWLRQLALRLLGRGAKNTLLKRRQLEDWGAKLGLSTHFIAGASEDLGQSVCLFRKSGLREEWS